MLVHENLKIVTSGHFDNPIKASPITTTPKIANTSAPVNISTHLLALRPYVGKVIGFLPPELAIMLWILP